MKKLILSFESKLFFLLCAISLVFSFVILNRNDFAQPHIRSDGIGYYSYLPATFIHRDLSMRKLADASFGGEIPVYTGMAKFEDTGKYLNIYPIGEAVMIAPFFAMAHLSAHIWDYPTDGYSPIYQVFAGIASAVYVMIGLFFLFKLLSKYFSQRITIATLFCIFFGTNLFEYATADSIFSHGFSFSLFAIFLYLTDLFYEKPTIKKSLLIGITSAFIFLVRNTNIYFLMFFPLYNLLTIDSLKERISFFYKNYKYLVYILLISLFLITPQFIYTKYITGHWIFDSYTWIFQNYYNVSAKGSFDFSHPQISNVLFSARKGLFFWAPILLFSIPGFFLVYKKAKPFFLPLVIYLIIHLYIVASWRLWAFGGSYGHRAFIESLVVFSFGIASFFSIIKKDIYKLLISAICISLVIINLIQIMQYWRMILPIDHITWDFYKLFFLRM